MFSRQSVTKRKANKDRRNYQQPGGLVNVDYTTVLLYRIKGHVKKTTEILSYVQNIVKNEAIYSQTQERLNLGRKLFKNLLFSNAFFLLGPGVLQLLVL